MATLAEMVGTKPEGFRAPGWELSLNTIGLLEELDVAYDSSMFGSDFTPYLARRDDTVIDGVWSRGVESRVWEVPVSWELDDFPAFFLRPPGFTMGRNPSEVLETWKAEFDFAHEQVPGAIFTLTMHPMVIGRGPRLVILDRLIAHIRDKPGVRFACLADVVRELDRSSR